MSVSKQNNICPNCFYSPYRGGICPRCRYTATESAAGVLDSGVVLDGKYILGRLLGVGGFGVTYLALNFEANAVQAIKEYFPTTMAGRDGEGNVVFNGSGDKRIFDYGYQTFRREADYLKRFRGDPLIVQVSHSFDANDTTYFVMEYLDGVNLKALQRGMGGRVPYPYARDVFESMLGALKRIHAKGLIHRDISPENIFITKDGGKKIIDFGATREVNADGAGTAILLKPGFAPPEQYSSRGNQGPWTDIYALAASFYYVVSGVKPADAREREAGVRVAPLDTLVPEIDGAMSAAIDRALALRVEDRYQSADEMARALPSVPAAPWGEATMGRFVGRMSGVPFIMIERGHSQGEKWPIPQNVDIKIGRQPGMNNVVIFDKSISREHSVIRYDSDAGYFILRDVSTNGTFSDKGARYRRGENIALAPGSRFFLAKDNIMMRVGLG